LGANGPAMAEIWMVKDRCQWKVVKIYNIFIAVCPMCPAWDDCGSV
jgi:hypothetical protein